MRMIYFAVLLLPSLSLRGDDLAKEPAIFVSAKIADIKSEIETHGPHPWAGGYSAGDGFYSLELWIAPANGAVFRLHDCFGFSEENHGPVAADQSQLTVNWMTKNDRSWYKESRLLVVPWRDSVYLVPNRVIHQFCINARANAPLPLRVLRREGAPTESFKRRPVLPERYSPFIDLDPIEARVTSVEVPVRKAIGDGLDSVTQQVVLNVGKLHHVFVGMRFESKVPNKPDHIVTITEVRPNDSTGQFELRRNTGTFVQNITDGWLFQTATW